MLAVLKTKCQKSQVHGNFSWTSTEGQLGKCKTHAIKDKKWFFKIEMAG